MKTESFSCVLIRENELCFVIFDKSGTQLEKWEAVSWRGRGCRETLIWIIEELKIHCKERILRRVLLSIPGEVTQSGICRHCPSLGWGRVSPEKIWKENSDIPTHVVSKRNMMLLGELRKQNVKRVQTGRHRGAVFLGENLETALLINGEFIGDQHGNYSDLGKIPVRRGQINERQSWFRLREEASYTEMEKKYRKLKKEYAHVIHSTEAVNDITEIAETAEEGNPLARKVIDEAAEAVVRGITCFASVIALERVFICGKDNEINRLLKKRIRFFSEQYGLETAMYYTIPEVETEVSGCIDFTLFL